MKKTIHLFCCLSTALLLTTLASCSDDDSTTNNPPVVVKPNLEFYGLTASNSLLKYNANNVTTIISTTPITNLPVGETLLAIDFRPATGQLYGLSSASRLYLINRNSGVASAIGATAFSPVLNGSLTGFDFNPTVDRVRIVTSSGQNLRLNPETGAAAATDTNLNPGTPNVGAAAYTNNNAGASTTELFVIDYTSGMLYKQDPPNAGTLTAIGSLGLTPTTGDGGFDIDAKDGIALANLNVGGALTSAGVATIKAPFVLAVDFNFVFSLGIK